MVLSFFFLLGSLGLGMFISARARSQLLATQVAMIATFLPAFLLSGFMFAIEVMPRALRAFTFLIPARYFVVVTRGIFLKGVGIPVLHVQGLLMVALRRGRPGGGGGELQEGAAMSPLLLPRPSGRGSPARSSGPSASCARSSSRSAATPACGG